MRAHIFSFRKSLKMPYLNFGRGLVVSIAHISIVFHRRSSTAQALRMHHRAPTTKKKPTNEPIMKPLAAVGRNHIFDCDATDFFSVSSRFEEITGLGKSTCLAHFNHKKPTHLGGCETKNQKTHTRARTQPMEHDDDFYRFFSASFIFDSWTQCVKRTASRQQTPYSELTDTAASISYLCICTRTM